MFKHIIAMFRHIIDNFIIGLKLKDIKREVFDLEDCLTATPMYPHLPFELYRDIIDNFRDDRATLCTTSLVCKTFLHASRYHLFYHVTISNDPTARVFLDFLNSSTSPWPYVRDLHVYQGYHQILLLLIAPCVSNITTLELDSLVWDELGNDAQAVMLSGFPLVNHLKIVMWDFKTSQHMNDFIASFPSLSHIDCGHSRWESYREPVTPLPRSLKSITLSSFHSNFFDRLLILESHPNIHTIFLSSIDEEDIPAVGRLLKTLGSRLEHLRITVSTPGHLLNVKG
jgi:hypothetical protein